MTATIQPVETSYAGHRFRSRLEARWAVFFDALGMRWLYEPQGYDIGGRWYLPDLWLPDVACWVEVKGRFAPGGWDLLAQAVWSLPAQPEGLPVGPVPALTPSLLVCGEIPDKDSAPTATHPLIEWGVGPGRELITAFRMAAFRGTNVLMPYGPAYRAASVMQPNALLGGGGGIGLKAQPKIAAAYTRVRMARFEHGEQSVRATA